MVKALDLKLERNSKSGIGYPFLSGIRGSTRQIMEQELSDPIRILVYHLSDGSSSDDIEKTINKKATDVTIRTWWKKWARVGIMEIHPKFKKRYVKIFNVEDFGIEIPDVPLKVQPPQMENQDNLKEQVNTDE